LQFAVVVDNDRVSIDERSARYLIDSRLRDECVGIPFWVDEPSDNQFDERPVFRLPVEHGNGGQCG
jgi:hypothetical protein